MAIPFLYIPASVSAEEIPLPANKDSTIHSPVDKELIADIRLQQYNEKMKRHDTVLLISSAII
ncbi:hypothetical protein ACR79M_16265 [Sphingobacterium spiritivorum]|uniref:hypothetical protein n=1 Tax=Sphingobacterium spiritivorum TaxID=258 RepID=UPI003DA44602